jgi:hypothetical protein
VPTFPIRYGAFSGPFLGLLGLGRRRSTVSVADGAMRVRMGWAFDGAASLESVQRAEQSSRATLDRGVHGWRGDWLVNGAGEGIVEIRLDPPMRARTMGWPLRVHRLRVSVEDPAGLVSALGRPA